MTVDYAQPLTRTWLSLDRYAHIMGISPAPFNTATADTVFPIAASCNDLVFKYSWQNSDGVSHSDLVEAIRSAEDDIASVVGYPLAPTWIEQDIVRYPQYHRRDVYAYNCPGSVKASYGKIIAPGRRAVTRVGDSAIDVEYLDQDSDGFYETARVAVATSLTDEQEIRVYFAGTSGQQEWEIRPERRKTISGGSFTADFWTWQMIDPDLREVMPDTDGNERRAIDISGYPPGNVVSSVDVYREYNDTTRVSAQYIWESATQDGCFNIKDAAIGIVVPFVATYDETEGSWTPSVPSVSYAPNMVKLWYYAGDTEPLSDFWAVTIAWLATARLERPLCTCGVSERLFKDLMTDYAANTREASRTLSFEIINNPFGTRGGEIRAWRRVSKLVGQNLGGYTI